MDLEDGKLQNNIKLLTIEKSRDELFTTGKGNMFKVTFSVVIAFTWV